MEEIAAWLLIFNGELSCSDKKTNRRQVTFQCSAHVSDLPQFLSNNHHVISFILMSVIPLNLKADEVML